QENGQEVHGKKQEYWKMSVSVLICSHNGKARIGPTLEALAESKVGLPIEIILIDNNSIDGTAEAAQHTWDRIGAPFSFRIVRETQLGLAYARRKGVKEAAYEY